jgi:hypothetical protein
MQDSVTVPVWFWEQGYICGTDRCVKVFVFSCFVEFYQGLDERRCEGDGG